MDVHLLLVRSRRRLPVELLAELCDCVPHHRLGLAKLVTSYSSCPQIELLELRELFEQIEQSELLEQCELFE
uniref:F-box domain-containing protein n=1 Tax=Globodera pallida TaxID=36090 RepID=A0A183CAS2_GLOPA